MHNGVVGACEAVETLEEHLEEGGDHNYRKDEDTNWLQASAADGISILILVRDEFGCRPNDGCAEEVKGSVDQGSKDRQRAGKNNDCNLSRKKGSISGQVDIDCNYHYSAAAFNPIVFSCV